MTGPSVAAASHQPEIDALTVGVYDVPTSSPEADGTFAWDKTTLVVVHVEAARVRGLGYTYADRATAVVVKDHLEKVLVGRPAIDIPAAHAAMVHAIRNVGRAGVVAMAISAVDVALWDLKARLLRVPLVSLLGAARDEVVIYGSGGFTNYDLNQLERQLSDWVEGGIRRVKMKVGSDPRRDLDRVRAARRAIGDALLFVDANGAYTRKEALAIAEAYGELGVRWFEEPVSSDDLDGLRLLRDRAPANMDIAAGEYGYDPFYFRRMVAHGAVDVLQADATRCGGITGFLEAAAICDAFGIPLSAHCAPALHLHVAAAAPRLRHIEYFHDHVRIEQLLFDGTAAPRDGALTPDRQREGHGLVFRERDAARYAVR